MRQSVIFVFAYTAIFGSNPSQLIFGLRLSQAKPCTTDCVPQLSTDKLVDSVAAAAQGSYEGQAAFFQLPSSSSSSYAFEWQHEGFSECSVTCGEGIELSEVTCREYKTGRRVLDAYCDQTDKKPQRVVRPCWQAKCQAVWVAGEWGECSAICGGGVTRRLVYCAEEVDRGTFQRTLDRLCRAQKPDTEKTCNTDTCPQWHAGQWSKCSKSCGTGVQQRAIACKRTSTLDCIDDMKPVSERLCHQTPCTLRSDSDGDGRKRRPSSSSSSLIGRDLSDLGDPIKTYNYRHQNRGRETAAADGFRVRESGLVIIDDPHPLPLSPPTDHSEESGDGEISIPVTVAPRFFQPVTMIPIFVDGTTLRSEAVSSGDGETDELEGGSRGPAAIQFTDLRPVHDELDEYSVHQLEPRNELILTAARRSLIVNLLPGTDLRIYCRSNTAHTSSVWMRNGEGISKVTLSIRNVRQEQTGVYSCLRGNQMSKVTVRLTAPVEAQQDKEVRANVAVNPQKLQKKLQDLSKLDSGQPGVNLLLNNIIAPHIAMLDVVPLSYVASSEWTKCQCGAAEAFQTRSVNCEFVTETFSVEVDGSFCARQKVKSPLTSKDCSKTCYSWTVGDWKQCSGTPCVSSGVGTRWRLVECSGANGTPVAESRCQTVANRPANSESCLYKLCQATWIPMPWSECSVSCGYKGLKTREVRCIWTADLSETATDESMCSHEVKPTTQKLCFNPPCANRYCRDESLFCSNVPLFGLCHLQKYAQKCCYSCTKRYRPYVN